MKIQQLYESPQNFKKASEDPRVSKLLGIAFKQDRTIPHNTLAKLGPKPDDKSIVLALGDLIDQAFSSTDFGDISKDGKFDDYVLRQYMNGELDYEDISGEAADALGKWKALSKRGMLQPEHQDFNRFKNIARIQALMAGQPYREMLAQIADQEKLEKMKRDAKSITLIDNDRYFVAIPMNYGACYMFNNAQGTQASFCTGGSSGAQWFLRYADEGPIITVFDKENMDDINGKWQIHAPTNQIVNARQTNRYGGDEQFGQLFPGLMVEIVKAITSKAEEINQASKIIPGLRNGYDVGQATQQLANKFQGAFTLRPDQIKQNPQQPEA
jgi:hypothetical protein